MKSGEEADEVIEEIEERISQLKASIDTLKSSMAAGAIPLVLNMNIDVYTKTKKKTLKLIKDAKNNSISNRKRMKTVKELEQQAEKICEDFEHEIDLEEIKNAAPKDQDANINKVDDIEKMLDEFREAALVINHENRRKMAGEEGKEEENNVYGTFKKKTNGVPKSLRMVDMESERYQREKEMKAQSNNKEEKIEKEKHKSKHKWLIF